MKYIKHNTDFTFIYNGVQYRAKIKFPFLQYIDKLVNDKNHIYIMIYKNRIPNKYISRFYDPKIITLKIKGQYPSKYYNSVNILYKIKQKLDELLEEKLRQSLIRHTSDFGEIDKEKNIKT